MLRRNKQLLLKGLCALFLLLGTLLVPSVASPSTGYAYVYKCGGNNIWDSTQNKCVPNQGCDLNTQVLDDIDGCVSADGYVPTCPSGEIFSSDQQVCIKDTGTGCGPGQVYDVIDGCVTPTSSTNPPPSGNGGGAGNTGQCVIGNEAACSVNQANCSSANETVKHCTDQAVSGGGCNSTSNCNIISNYIVPLVNLLAAFAGTAVAVSIVIGAIQYGSSAGDSQKVTAAKNRIRNAIIALIAFVFLYALLNFLIPGGLV